MVPGAKTGALEISMTFRKEAKWVAEMDLNPDDLMSSSSHSTHCFRIEFIPSCDVFPNRSKNSKAGLSQKDFIGSRIQGQCFQQLSLWGRYNYWLGKSLLE